MKFNPAQYYADESLSGDSMRRERYKRIKYWTLRIAPGLILAFGALFTVFLWSQYKHLETAFLRKQEYLPTRIYSDVSRIAPPQPRSYIIQKLDGLSYDYKQQNGSIEFHLREVNYPHDLIPSGHSVFSLQGKKVILRFDGADARSVLQSIESGSQEYSDLYLEPEVVAILARRSSDSAGGVRTYRKLGDIPTTIRNAIIAIEDQHFDSHLGIDFKGLARAIFVNLSCLCLRQGGSTLTQQLVKNLLARRTKNIFKKFSEFFLAVLLEINFEKDEILERYLNEVYLGQVGSLEVHGVAEGARYFFAKHIEELNLAEVALLAGLIRGPGFYSPYRHRDRATNRQERVLARMVELGYVAPEEAKLAQSMPLRFAKAPSGSNKAPYFSDYVKAQVIEFLSERLTEQEISDRGLNIYTTLDLAMNRAAQKAVREGVIQAEERFNIHSKVKSAATIQIDGEEVEMEENQEEDTRFLEGALAAVDHRTGYIRALVGGRNYNRSTFNRILNMKRQVGSTFKPVVYLTALRMRRDDNNVPYGPAYPILDAPWELSFDQGRQSWSPGNYDGEFRGWIPLRTALAQSVNIAAAKLGVRLGLDNIRESAKLLGIESKIEAVPSITLGASDLSPVELLAAYATIANHGVRDELTVIRSIRENNGEAFMRFVFHPKQYIDPGDADLLTDMMRQAFVDGTAKSAYQMGFTRAAAGKTGTTSHHRDSWFAGFTPELTTVVWVGVEKGDALVEDGKAQVKLTGAGTALPIWVSFMKDALSSTLPSQFPLSEHLSSARVDARTGNLATSICPETQVLNDKYRTDNLPDRSTCAEAFPDETELAHDFKAE